MNHKNPSQSRSLKQNSSRLAAYLATGIGSGIVATPVAEAAIVNIDLTITGFDLTGVNAGLSSGGGLEIYKIDYNFPISGGGTIFVRNATLFSQIGILGYSGLSFAAGSGFATPAKFTLGDLISSSTSWGGEGSQASLFKALYYDNDDNPVIISSPDFGPGSYMGFKTLQGNYGWLSVTWAGATDEFQIYSGAYEDEVGVAIAAGATAAVPEPSTIALLALGAAGVALNRRQAKKRQG